MSPLDWAVLFGTLAVFVAYGLWRSRGERDLTDYLLAGRAMPWPMVAISVMATQASAVTFLSTPGQGFADGLRFVQFYFGLPLAMVVLCVTAIPIYQRLRVFTAYEYLQGRFDGKTRTLTTALFLLQRGLAAGITIYAPALVLSVVLGWELRWTCVLLGVLAALYTASGGSKAVSHAHALQFTIILATMVVAFAVVIGALPKGVGFVDALHLAGAAGRMHAIEPRLDLNDRYTLWSGLIGGFFLQLSYFGTDQSQVGRYLTGSSVTQSRLGLLFNGLVKIPMQFFILLLGVMVFVFYLFQPQPVYFDPVTRTQLEQYDPTEWGTVSSRHEVAWEARRDAAQRLAGATRRHDAPGALLARLDFERSDAELADVRKRTVDLIRERDPKATGSDVNFVFLGFVLTHLPVGLIGLVFAAVFAASMNASSSELNALTSTTVVDVLRRLPGWRGRERRDLWVSRLVTVAWAGFAVLFAEGAARLGSLIEAVNILGSLFYGTILGVFLTAFLLKRVGGTAVFAAAIVAEAAVIACFRLTQISFLWYNLIGCVLVMAVALAIQAAIGRERPEAAAA